MPRKFQIGDVVKVMGADKLDLLKMGFPTVEGNFMVNQIEEGCAGESYYLGFKELAGTRLENHTFLERRFFKVEMAPRKFKPGDLVVPSDYQMAVLREIGIPNPKGPFTVTQLTDDCDGAGIILAETGLPHSFSDTHFTLVS